MSAVKHTRSSARFTSPAPYSSGDTPLRAVRSLGVVFDPPALDNSSGLRHHDEPVLVQTLISRLLIEGLDVGIFVGFARSNGRQHRCDHRPSNGGDLRSRRPLGERPARDCQSQFHALRCRGDRILGGRHAEAIPGYHRNHRLSRPALAPVANAVHSQCNTRLANSTVSTARVAWDSGGGWNLAPLGLLRGKQQLRCLALDLRRRSSIKIRASSTTLQH